MKTFSLSTFSTIIYGISLSFRSLSTYRSATWLKLISSIFLVLVYIFLWTGIYGDQLEINGYTLPELMLFIILLRAMRQIYPFHISRAYAQMVKDGSIYSWLLKPMPVEVRLFSNAIGSGIYNFIFTGLPSLLLIPLFVRSAETSPTAVLTAIFWILSAYIFIFLFEITIGALSYYTTSIWGISSLKTAFIAFFTGELMPLSFYPQILLGVLRILPFGAVFYAPISVILGRPVEPIALAVLWLSIPLMLIIYKLLSFKMIKNIMIQGG